MVVYSEFQLIHELCLYVLSASQRTELVRATLSTLHAFLSWIPLGYIFESPLVGAVYSLTNAFEGIIIVIFCYLSTLQLETLLKFFPIPAYRNLTLQCITEVCCIIWVLMVLPIIFENIAHFWCLQVAALQFGNYYDVQYVKMYNIFMVQLQVCSDMFLFHMPYATFCTYFYFMSICFSSGLFWFYSIFLSFAYNYCGWL